MANRLFYYEVEHFYKNSGPSWTVTMQAPERDEGGSWLLKWSNNKETDSDWQLGDNGNNNFIKKDRYIIIQLRR